MELSEYIKQDGIGLAKLIKQKQIKPQEPLLCAMQLIEQLNPQLNAVVAEHFDLALTQLHKANSSAPFYGVPTLVKDLYFAIKGTPLTNGSRYFQHNTSTSNCQFTQALLDSGSLILGKTNTAELGLSYSCESSLFGACHNPWNLSLSPGGSSGGSAAAVAARIVPFAAGNDSGGSLRTPAACCGVFGLKPTHGSTPHNYNEAEQWSGLLSNHVITRTVRDSHQIFTTLKKDQHRARTPTKQKDTIKIALLSGVFPQVDIHSDCQDAVELAASMSEQFGHRVEPVNLQIDTHRIDQAIFVIIAINILNVLKQQKQRSGRSHNAHNIESITQAFANSARQMRQCDILQAKKAIHDSIKPLQLLFLDYDIVLTPAIAQPPIALGCITPSDDLGQFMQKCTRFSPFTGLFNQSGQPAMTLPVLFRDQQPPISVQFAAGLHQEHLLFELAYQFERRNPWAEKIPLITQPFI